MTSLNKLGLTVVIITALALGAVFTAWWSIKTYLLAAKPETTPTPIPTLAPDTSFGSLPSPQVLSQTGPWTQKYLAASPAPDIENFVNANKGQLLPTLSDGTVKTKAETSEASHKKYAEEVSHDTNPALHAIIKADIESAWRLSFQNSQPQVINDVIQKLLENVKILEAVIAPQDQEALHTKIVSASHALVNNAELLRDTKSDWVGALIGAKNIDELQPVLTEIETEVATLKSGE